MTPLVRRSVAVLVLVVVAAACSASADSPESAAAPESPPTTESALVELPPPTTQPAPTTAEAPATTTAVAESTETIALESWDWGVPCRVPVTQIIGATFTAGRTFDVVVTETADGYRLDFENEVTDASPDFLANRLAVLPTVLLDDRGRFLGFEDLQAELSELDEQVSAPIGVDDAYTSAVMPLVHSITYGAWGGLWSDRGALGPEGVGTVEQRTMGNVAYPADVTVAAVPVTGGPRVAEFGESAARFSYLEIGADQTTVGGRPIALEVEATAFLDAETLRPFETTVHTVLFWTEDGRRADTVFDIEIDSEFDWENAEGCE